MEGIFVVDLVMDCVYYSPKIRLVASDCLYPKSTKQTPSGTRQEDYVIEGVHIKSSSRQSWSAFLTNHSLAP